MHVVSLSSNIAVSADNQPGNFMAKPVGYEISPLDKFGGGVVACKIYHLAEFPVDLAQSFQPPPPKGYRLGPVALEQAK